jgi:hypothetical protein
MSDKLHARLPQFYAELHNRKAFSGDSWVTHSDKFWGWVDPNYVGILDYGCGPDGGLGHSGDYRVISYDPYVPKYAEDPWAKPFDVFFSCDVFEHLPLEDVWELMRRIVKHKKIKLVFLAISTRPATKTFSNGLNVHLTVKSPEWWKGMFDTILRSQFDAVQVTADLLRDECVFVFKRRSET